MDDQNPFEVTPQSVGGGVARSPDGEPVQVSSRSVELLTQTRPWVMFIAVLLIIGGVLMGLMGIGLMLMAALSTNRLPGFEGPMGAAMGAFYLFLALIYFLPARWMFTFCSRVRDLESTEQAVQLEDALEALRNFWRLIGYICIAFMALYAIALLAMCAGVGFMAVGMQGR